MYMGSFFVFRLRIMQAAKLLEKYGEIIAEEVNVKEVTLLDDTVTVIVTYVPLGQKIGSTFGKDTSQVIAAAKAWNAVVQSDGSLLVTAEQNEWVLAPDMYEIRYSGLEEDHQTIEWWVIVSLDITITEELKQEWVSREISRFLNQMRKDAQLQIDKKVGCLYSTESAYLEKVIETFAPFLQEEALLISIEKTTSLQHTTFSQFVVDEWEILFTLID